MFDLSESILIFLLLACFFYCFSALRINEIAFRASKAYCIKMDVQMLDDYVALHKWRLRRSRHGKISVWRLYVFEFTATGAERYNGRITLLGDQVLSIHLDPYRISDSY